jgi:hypothetical protein
MQRDNSLEETIRDMPYSPGRAETHTISCYLFLVHAHLDQTRPDSLGLSHHAGKLRSESMVSHDWK